MLEGCGKKGSPLRTRKLLEEPVVALAAAWKQRPATDLWRSDEPEEVIVSALLRMLQGVSPDARGCCRD